MDGWIRETAESRNFYGLIRRSEPSDKILQAITFAHVESDSM